MERAGGVILEVAERFAEMSGRKYSFFEEYRTEDAEYLMVIMGSAAGTAKAAVDMLREEGHKVGVLKLRVFRPFPEKEIAEAIRRSGCKAVAIMDRCESYNGCSGPLGSEIPAGLYRNKVMVCGTGGSGAGRQRSAESQIHRAQRVTGLRALFRYKRAIKYYEGKGLQS